MPYITRGGARLFYQTWGARRIPSRPAVVLLHGLGSASDDWPLQTSVFARRYPVIALDAPGHGNSGLPPGPVTIAHMAAALAGLLEQLGEPPAHLVGLSLGGCMALQAALDYPERVRSLVLVNSFARLAPAGLGGVLRFARRMGLLLTAPMRATAEVVAHGLFPRPDQREFYEAAAARLASNSRWAYLRTIWALLRFDVRRRLPQVRCATLVVAGERDRTIPMSAKVQLQQGISGARLAVVPDSGHATAYDQAEVFNKIVLEFLADCDD